MKLNQAFRPSTNKRTAKLRRACDKVVHFDGLEERRLMTVFTVTNTLDAGQGSLREAIVFANTAPGADTIAFDTGGGVAKIELASELPALTGPVTIDGTTQAGFAGAPLVWLDGGLGINGQGVPTFAGLQIQGGDSSVRGLALTRFDGAINLSGGAGDTVTGCYIGFDPTGATPDSSYGNFSFGIGVQNSGSTIGGTAPGDGNVIAANNQAGIFVSGDHVRIIGNQIGAATGLVVQGNGSNGIELDGASDVTIGGLLAGEGNLISANFADGIRANNSSHLQIIGNTIGGTTVDPDVFVGNYGDGISIWNVGPSSGVLINSNLIASNLGDGIRLTDASGVTVTGNVIGSTSMDFDTGALSGNHGDAIGLMGTSSGNHIGGTAPGEGNIIAYSQGAGVAIYRQSDPAQSGINNAIRGNSIHDNSIAGIDLTEEARLVGFDLFSGFGPTANDSAGHIGPNHYQNFPVMGTSSRNAVTGALTLHGSLAAAPNGTYSIDLFGNQTASPTGYGEGELYLGTITVTTDGAGHAAFTATFSNVDPMYVVFTATATDSAGNTSEFSQVNNAVALGSTTTLTTSLNPATYGTSVTFTATVAGSGVGAPSGDVTFMDGNQVLGTVALNANGEAVFSTSTLLAGNHSIVAIFAGDAQYGGSTSAMLSETVNAKVLTVTVNDASKTYGSANPAFGAHVDGFVLGEDPSALAGTLAFYTGANSSSGAGSYVIHGSGLMSSNYDITYVDGSLLVDKAVLTVTVNNASKTYGQANPTFTTSYSGFVNGDGVASLGGTLVISSPGVHAGTFALAASGQTSNNYAITYVDGALTITKASLTITADSQSKVYGASVPSLSASYSGFVNGDDASSLAHSVLLGTMATSASNAGIYAITASGATSGDYDITFVNGTLTVAQAGTATILSSSASSSNAGQAVTFTATVAGSPVAAPTGTVTFFDNGVSLGSVALVNGVATLVTSDLGAGGHTITATYNGSANYLTSSSAPLGQTVTASLTISGTALNDLTGNGLSSDDTPMAGVTVNLYTDTDHNGVLSAADQIVAHTVSGANGAYTFTAQPGTYFIGEVTPTGYLQTGPATPLYYTLNAPNGGASIDNDFDNFLIDCDVNDVTNVSYLINGTTVVDQLRGNVHQGDTVQVIFTVPAGAAAHPFSFVTYTAPGSTFDADNAHQQMVYDSDTGVFGPGVHTMTVTVPDAYFQIDFVCGEIIDHLGPAGSNIFYTPQGRLLGADNGGTQAPINAPSSISGFVYLDTNNNGTIDILDGVIAGVKVTLTGTDDHGKSVSMVEFTDADGRYFFGGLRPGTYSLLESQPTGVSDGKETLGSIANSAASSFGTASNNRFSNIKIVASRDGINYNFGELGSAVHHGQTAAVGFWQNSSGQALLKCLNNGSTDTNLGIWLAANFPNLYGQNAGAASLLGKTNAQIAAFYTTLYKTTAQKLDAQVLALAFATYVTDASLAGTVARNYSFEVTDTGVGSATYNVGSNGAAFGVANNSTVAVSQLLQIADNKSWNGTLWDADHSGTLSATESSWRNMAYTIFNAINNAGGL